MFSIISHGENATSNHNEILLHVLECIKLETLVILTVDEDVEQPIPLHTADENGKQCNHYRREGIIFFKKLNICLSYD